LYFVSATRFGLTVGHNRHYKVYKYRVEYVKITLSELRSVLQCFIMLHYRFGF